MATDRNDATRGTRASVRLVLGGIIAAVIVALVMIMLVGKHYKMRDGSIVKLVSDKGFKAFPFVGMTTDGKRMTGMPDGGYRLGEASN